MGQSPESPAGGINITGSPTVTVRGDMIGDDQIIDLRLANQQLTKPTLRTPAEIVAALGAVQAQDYAGAKWALAQRLAGALTTPSPPTANS